MRRWIVIAVICVLAFAVAAWAADNSNRIAQLQARQKDIVLEINDRQIEINQQQAAIDSLRIEYAKNQGAIEELQRQDAEQKASAADK